jgi:hypothetical protein
LGRAIFATSLRKLAIDLDAAGAASWRGRSQCAADGRR